MTRIGIVIATMLFGALSLFGQEPSLGEVVKAQKAAKTKNAPVKVVDEAGLMEMRAHNHGGPAAECDAACETAIRAALEDRKKMTDSEWAEAFADGRSELESDSDWQELFPQLQRAACPGSAAKDSQPSDDASRKLARKVLQETKDSLQGLGQVMNPGASEASREHALREIRAKAVKLQIIKFAGDRAKQTCTSDK